MVFENLIGPKEAKRKPWKVFFLGILFSAIAIAFSLWIFPTEASLVIVFLIVLMSIPLMYFTLLEEEQEDFKFITEARILREHGRAIKFLLFLFLGFVVGFALFYILFPESLVQNVFSLQLDTISNINGAVISGSSVTDGAFISILSNNLKVLFFCLLFALFFGAGAIFILAWNASVISAAVGTYVRNGLAQYASLFGFDKLAVHFNLFISGMLRYMIHGIFEIAAYFIAGLAGGIISLAVVNKHVRSFKLRKVLKDAGLLIAIAILLLVIGALIEVFVTPLFF